MSCTRLLLVDPVEASRVALAQRLTSLGFTVETAEDGVEGAAVALASPPAAVIADLWMPGVSGIQLCRLLQAEAATSAMPVLLRGDEDDRRNRFWAGQAGAFALVGKGRVGELVRVLRRALLVAPPPDDFFFQLAGGSAIRDRIAKHLDAALFESVIASEVRAFASCDSTTRLFDLLSQFLSQLHGYRWLALRGPELFGVHHRAGEGDAAVAEARLALGCPEAEAFVLEDEDPVGGTGACTPIVQAVTFGNRKLGTIALAPDPARVAEAVDLVRVVSRELGGALRMTTLVEETRKLAATDGLTRLMNRRAFVEWGERELARISRYDGSLGLAILDVDHFKSINDRFGHGNGDRVLVEVARRVTAVLRAADVAARWGGEELVMAFPGGNADGYRIAAERVRAAIATVEMPIDGCPPITVTASIGVAALRRGESLDALIERADAAMYEGKHAGRNRVVSAEPRVEPLADVVPITRTRGTSSAALPAVSTNSQPPPREEEPAPTCGGHRS